MQKTFWGPLNSKPANHVCFNDTSVEFENVAAALKKTWPLGGAVLIECSEYVFILYSGRVKRIRTDGRRGFRYPYMAIEKAQEHYRNLMDLLSLHGDYKRLKNTLKISWICYPYMALKKTQEQSRNHIEFTE